MNQDRWQQIEALYHAALELPEGERATYINEVCAGDAALRDEVATLIAEAEQPDGYLSKPTLTLGLSLLASERAGTLAGKQLGTYRINRQLGRGGMGEVYLAEDPRLGRLVALKVLPAFLTDMGENVLRFQQEARASSAISHPNVAHIYEAGAAEGRHFLAMEYVEGVTLRQMLKGDPLDAATAVGIAAQVAQALAAAHEAGVVHRDIKPENIMVRADGYVKVLDFGLAKLYESQGEVGVRCSSSGSSFDTTPGVIMGTTAYMSPEQVRGYEMDARTDLWSLGVILYEMLTGRRPFAGDTPSDVAAAILLREPSLATIPEVSATGARDLRSILRGALQKVKERRCQSAQALARELKVIARELEIGQHLSGRNQLEERPVRRIPAGEDAPVPETRLEAFSVSARHLWSQQNRPAKLSLAALAIACLTFTVSSSLYYLFNWNSVAPAPATTTSTGRSATRTIDSLVILPFTNQSDDKQMDYFAKGVVDDLISDLGRTGNLRVIALGSARKIKLEPLVGYDQIKQKLGVSTLLRGEVRRQEKQLIIVTQLIGLNTGEIIWHETFAANPHDSLKLRDTLTVLLFTNLQNFLGGEKRLFMRKYSTASNEAYEAYLEGKYSRTRAGSEGLKNSIKLLKKAIELDPNYALAYVELANEYNLLGTFMGHSPEFYQPKAKETIKKALELDDSLAEAHTALAKIKMDYDHDWEGCEREFKRALEINPGYALAHHWYGEVYLSAMGRLDEAIDQLNIARALDPLSTGVITGLAWSYIGKREYGKALELCNQALALDSQDWSIYSYRAQTLLKLGRFDDAIRDAQKAFALEDDSNNLAVLGALYGYAGRSDDAREALTQLRTDSRYRGASKYALAIVHAALGERDEAFRLLNEEVSTLSVGLLSIQIDPLLDSIRDDARFSALVKRFNFPPTN